MESNLGDGDGFSFEMIVKEATSGDTDWLKAESAQEVFKPSALKDTIREPPDRRGALGNAEAKNKSILLAEDDATDRFALRRMLENLDYPVIAIGDGAQAIEIARPRPRSGACAHDGAARGRSDSVGGDPGRRRPGRRCSHCRPDRQCNRVRPGGLPRGGNEWLPDQPSQRGAVIRGDQPAPGLTALHQAERAPANKSERSAV